MNKIVSLTMSILLLVMLVSCGASPEKVVKNGSFNFDPGAKIEKVFDSYFDKSNWDSFKDDQGRKIVQFTGSLGFKSFLGSEYDSFLEKNPFGNVDRQVGGRLYGEPVLETSASEELFEEFKEALKIPAMYDEVMNDFENIESDNSDYSISHKMFLIHYSQIEGYESEMAQIRSRYESYRKEAEGYGNPYEMPSEEEMIDEFTGGYWHLYRFGSDGIAVRSRFDQYFNSDGSKADEYNDLGEFYKPIYESLWNNDLKKAKKILDKQLTSVEDYILDPGKSSVDIIMQFVVVDDEFQAVASDIVLYSKYMGFKDLITVHMGDGGIEEILNAIYSENPLGFILK